MKGISHIKRIGVRILKVIEKEEKLCLVCMEKHEVQKVKIKEIEVFKGQDVEFDAIYEYCSRADEYIEKEDMNKINSLAMKDAYREKKGLLTSKEIISIRKIYGVSQKDFSEILDWGRATITRYENHQIQNRSHDDILRKVLVDPKWFIQMLKRAEGKIVDKAFRKYMLAAKSEFIKKKNNYLIDSINSHYAKFSDSYMTDEVELNLNKLIEIINYLARKVYDLRKVKLAKMLWYLDSLSIEATGKSLTGLKYNIKPIGVFPEGYEIILKLEGINFETVLEGFDYIDYRFYPAKDFKIRELKKEEIQLLNVVIREFDKLNFQEILSRIEKEKNIC